MHEIHGCERGNIASGGNRTELIVLPKLHNKVRIGRKIEHI